MHCAENYLVINIAFQYFLFTSGVLTNWFDLSDPSGGGAKSSCCGEVDQ